MSWKSFQLNLPIVPITDLTIKDNSLIVATQGRSLWVLDDLTVLHQLNNKMDNSEMILFKPKDVKKYKNGFFFESHLKNYGLFFYLDALSVRKLRTSVPGWPCDIKFTLNGGHCFWDRRKNAKESI